MNSATERLLKSRAWNIFAVGALWFASVQGAWAETVETLQTDWARASYELTGKARVASLETLVERARDATTTQSNRADLHIWHGIIASSLAGEDGGLGALGLVKEARRALTRAIELDETALGGAAYTSLGALYHKVPGWPIAFGSDKKARRYLQMGIQQSPAGIDANYFLGEFLFDEGEPAKARLYLEKALEAPAREARPLADEGRRTEIIALLARLRGVAAQ